MMFRFEKFDVWHRAIDFADLVYEISSKFPGDERFGLTSQMRRAAVSVSSNIAEGTSRNSDREFARFIEIAYGSLMEVVSQSRIAVRQSFMPETAQNSLEAAAAEVARMLSGLRTSLSK